MRVDRLRVLEAALREPLPEGFEFNMGVYYVENACGTVCCALGLATTVPELATQGLVATNMYVMFDGELGLDAASEFFDLEDEVAAFLFHPTRYGNEYVPPVEVADRISDLVRFHEDVLELNLDVPAEVAEVS